MQTNIEVEVLELEPLCGTHISTVSQNAINKADKEQKPVHFKFNDIDVTVQPNEIVETVIARWDADREAANQAWFNSPEYAERERKREADAKAAREAHMIESAATEKEMAEAKTPWPQTKEQLVEYVESLVHRSHNYETCVYAMSMAAEAAFNYVAGTLGVTGFQSSCADLDFLRRTRLMKGPFMIIKAEDFLYPQYNPEAKLYEAELNWAPWLRDEAMKKLAEAETDGGAHPAVVAHWKKLTQYTLPDPEALNKEDDDGLPDPE